MLSRSLRAAAVAIVAVLLLSACELTVRIGTTVEADGSGGFSLSMLLDEELVTALEQTGTVTPGSDVSSLEQLFEQLAAQGWVTTRSTPRGGLLLQAVRPFEDQAGFERALAELGRAGGTEEGPVDLGSLTLDFEVDRSFLRTESRFSGAIDLRFGADVDPLLEQIQDVLAEAVRFEVRATLPGQVEAIEGAGSVEEDGIVWRPTIGSSASFEATASQLRAGSLLLILVPALVLIAILAWVLVGRRPQPDIDAPPTPAAGAPPALDEASADTAPHRRIDLSAYDVDADGGATAEQEPLGNGTTPGVEPIERRD